MECNLCPRHCKVDREKTFGFCGQKALPKIANYSLHMWEEPCISYKKGSGTVFFSGCSLKCVYCQNYEISSKNVGQEISIEDLANVFKELDQKADNINLVTPTHFSDSIIKALKIYRPKNPVIYNTHGYELESEIEKISPYIDIFLTDLKYYSPELSQKYSGVSNYFEIASRALKKMVSLKTNVFKNGKMLSGVIVRHMLLPSHLEDSKQILKFLAENFPSVTLSLMAQYTPLGRASDFPEINRKITEEEYDELIDFAISLGLDGYMQELSSADDCFVPKFSNNVLPS